MRHSTRDIFILAVIFFIQNTLSSTDFLNDNEVDLRGYLGSKETKLFYPYVDFEIDHVEYTGNPFDVEVNITFIHTDTKEIINSQAFYDGDWVEETYNSTIDRWIIRFSGTKLGEWTFFTSSKTTPLDGLSGTIKVHKQDNEKVIGELYTNNKWFKTRNFQNNKRGFLPLVYRDQGWASKGYGWPPVDKEYPSNNFRWQLDHMPVDDEDRLDEMIDVILYGDEELGIEGLKDLGANTLYLGGKVFNFLLHFPYDFGDSNNPYFDKKKGVSIREGLDLRCFRQLERIISRMAEHGIVVIFRIWGSADVFGGNSSPTFLAGGMNGEISRRIQRYFSARLGALNNWIILQGYDQYAGHIKQVDVLEMVSYMKQHLGWNHLFSVREWQRDHYFKGGFWMGDDRLDFTEINEAPHKRWRTDSVTRWPFENPPRGWPDFESDDINDFYSLAKYWHEKLPYNMPLLFGAQFLYRRTQGDWRSGEEGYEYWTMDRTRRAMWQFAMAEGAWAMWGITAMADSPRYPNPEQFKIFGIFWEKYLKLDFEMQEKLSNGYTLASLDNENKYYIFYKEEISSVNILKIDLTYISNLVKAVAVNTKGDRYIEIDISENIQAGEINKWSPYIGNSDYVVFIKGD